MSLNGFSPQLLHIVKLQTCETTVGYVTLFRFAFYYLQDRLRRRGERGHQEGARVRGGGPPRRARRRRQKHQAGTGQCMYTG